MEWDQEARSDSADVDASECSESPAKENPSKEAHSGDEEKADREKEVSASDSAVCCQDEVSCHLEVLAVVVHLGSQGVVAFGQVLIYLSPGLFEIGKS